MQKLRITISNVLKNQLPDFVKEQYPLVEELFSEYYKGQEYQGGVLDILQNIDQYIKLNNLTNLVDKTKITSNISLFATTIPVRSTVGFPDYYGLIQIDSEIILYKSKTTNSFNECVRGFSGINSYEKTLNFEETNAVSHVNDSGVKNLNILFLNEFLVKVKKQFAPGFENRKFFRSESLKVNENILIKQLRDFYSSKGTDISFKILFRALFNDSVEIIKPRDLLIKPSDAQYRVNKELVIEAIEGDPLDLADTTIYQNTLVIDGEEFISSAYGTVNRVQTISRKDKTYYVLSLDFDYNKDINLRGSTYGEFVIGPKTIITDNILNGYDVITVDSTYGFPPENGILRIKFNDGLDGIVTYERKNLNQFLGCVGITRDILQGQEVYLNYYCSGGNTVGDDENPIKFRITGVLAEATTESDSHYIVPGNRINLRTLGKDIQDPAFNNWKFNITPSYKVKNIILSNSLDNTYLITLFDEHVFSEGDSVKITSSIPQLVPGSEVSGLYEFIVNVLSVNGKDKFTCSSPINPNNGSKFELDTNVGYEVERRINKFKFTYNNAIADTSDKYITDVQNVYKSSDNDLYVASQSLPTYEDSILNITDDTLTLPSSTYISEESNQNDSEIIDKILNIGKHSFKTGDAVYYQPGTGNNRLNITEGVYYVKSIGAINDSTQIKLSTSRSNIDNNIFVDVNLKSPPLTGTDNKLFKTTDELIYFQNSVKNSLTSIKFERFISPKNVIKKISTSKPSEVKQTTNPGLIGILVNGVEIVNYKSNDYVYYGPINDIKIKSSGKDYDIINPPKLNITDKIGVGVSAICHVIGSLKKIDILDGGFDYESTPTIQISGGNGTGAEANANMVAFEYSESFIARPNSGLSTDTSLVFPNTITFNKKHKFYDGEPIKYSCTQEVVEGLEKDFTYYVASENEYTIGLYSNYKDALSKTNSIKLRSYASGSHYLASLEKKNKIGSINVVKSGNRYSNKKTVTSSENINIFSNVITVSNHGYKTGERIVYSSSGSPIVGVATTSEYIVYKVDENKFKLCEVNTDSTDRNFYLNTNQFVDLIDAGSGKHIFNYPPIEIKVIGSFKNKNLDSSELEAKIIPSFKGQISSIFIENGGVGYGSSDIINFNRQPDFVLESGKNAELRPIISNGTIVQVLIANAGSQYTSTPEIQIVGTGIDAKLLPIISNGRIEEVKIISGGINYDANGTILNVVSSGSGANFEFSINSWNVNLVERLIQNKNILSNDIILSDTKNEYNERMTQITHAYAPRKLRRTLLGSKIEDSQIVYKKDLTIVSGDEETTSTYHSPIIGWAYDGNPIYGPFGYTNPDGTGLVKRMKSGYALNTNNPNRPNINNFPRGFFVEDYDFFGNGDLDEFNGRYCVTPQYPNGVYAYFATLEDIDFDFSRNYSRPSFPYLIGNFYKSEPIKFNFDKNNDQNSIVFEDLNFIRNTTPYRFISKNSTYNYAFNPIDYEEPLNKISRVGSGRIDNITVISGGDNYKVGDKIILSEDEFGNKSYAEITKIKGKSISSIALNSRTITGVEFGSLNKSIDKTTVVGVASTPHQLKDQDIISIVGLNNILTNSEKNVSARIDVSSNQLTLTTNVDKASNTGIITSFYVDGNLNERVIQTNDIYLIAKVYGPNPDDLLQLSGESNFIGISSSLTLEGYTITGEEVKILGVDKLNSSILVERQQGGLSYTEGAILIEKPRRFKVDTLKFFTGSSDDKYYPLNKEIYFNPKESVGLGTVGINTSIFLKVLPLNYAVSISTDVQVLVGNSSTIRTGLIFNIPQYASQFKIGDYIDIVGATNLSFNDIKKAKVLNVGVGSITIDFNSSSLSGVGVTAFVTKWETRDVTIRSLYLPQHNLNTGDKVKYFKNSNSPIGVSTNKITSEDLSENDLIYVYKFDDDHIGIGKTIVGITSDGNYENPSTGESLLYFTSLGSGIKHSFKTDYDIKVGDVIKNVARITTTENPSLSYNENIDVSVKSNINRTIIVKYNKENRRLVLNPKSFIETDVDILNNLITIQNHGYSTGDKIIYSAIQDLTSQLQDNKIYYIVVYNTNTVRLSENYYDSISQNPTTVELTGTFRGTFSSVNPPIKLYRNETVKFDLSDKSLSFINNEILYPGFKFCIYKDSNFTDKFIKTEEDTLFNVRSSGIVGVTNNAYVEITLSDKTPLKLYYRFELDSVNYSVPQSQLEYFVDQQDIENNSTIFILDSVYGGNHKVYNFGNTFVEYLLKERPEQELYNSSNSELSYITNSYSPLGKIHDIRVLSKDRKYRILPGISSISSKTGSEAILFPYSEQIGSVKKVKIENIGFDYSSDYSLRPTGNLPQIIQVEPLSIFKDIKVTFIGKNYNLTPKLIVLDGLTRKQDKQAELKFVPEESTVEIIQNSSGLYNKTPYIIPINNSNGFTVLPNGVSYSIETKILRLTFNSEYSSFDEFPFSVGDRVLLENFKINTISIDENGEVVEALNVRGINSENYGYALFELASVDASIEGGKPSVTIDMSPYLNDDEIPGTYAPVNSLGYIVPESYFPTFEITLQKNNFVLGEEVISTSGYSGIVEYWDRENEFVSVLSDDKFVTGDRIVGKTSNLNGIVGKVEFFEAEYKTDAYSVVQRGWDTRTGFLNDNSQRIHDSDYYQFFSYDIKSKIEISDWNDAVSSLNHTSGFKKFGTLEIESSTPQIQSVGISTSELNAVADFFEIMDLNSYYNFDMVSENSFLLGNTLISDQVIFDTKDIQDYFECVGNRVLMIDDFSNQFNNIPRTERYVSVDKFPIYQNRYRKYFAYVKDKLFFNERQFSIISIIHDGLNGYVNQYGRLETANELGTFDFVINGEEGQIQFKPFDYEYNDFDVDLVSYSLFDTFVGIATTNINEYSIGTIAKFFNNVATLDAGSIESINIFEIPITYRSAKIILTMNSEDGIYREATELNIIHDGEDVYVTEYGRLFTENINPPVGLTTYNAYINDEKLYVDIVPYVGYGSTIEINSLVLGVRDNTATTPGVLSNNNTRLQSGYINIPSSPSPVASELHNYSYNYGGGYYYISIQDSSSVRYQSLELTTLNNQTNVYQTQFGSVITDPTILGLGTFSTQIVGSKVYLYFTPVPNKNIDIRFFYNGIKTITELDEDIPETEPIIDLTNSQIVSFTSDYIGTQNAIKRSFNLNHKKRPILRRTFRGNSSASVDLFNDKFIIPNHYFSTGEEVIYDFGGDDPVGIATTTIAGIGITDQLPSTLYVIKLNDLSVRVAASASQALKAIPEYLKLENYGVGSLHSFTGKKGNGRSLITLDNMIQSPIVASAVTTRLASNIELKDIRVKVEDPSIFIGGDIFKVDDEIIRVQIVGFGSTNTLLVNRYWMGTFPDTHTQGSVCTIMRGNYNIVENKIHFYDPPYGKMPIPPENPRYDEVDFTGITTHSTFSGRIFNKSGITNTTGITYDDNIVLDDISEQFAGLTTAFVLKENGSPISGISTSNLFVLVKDILQVPLNEEGDNDGAFKLGQNLSGDTQIIFNQQDIPTDLENIDINSTNIPTGGIILSVGSTFGSGYQPLKSAAGTANINNLGIITSVSIGFTGSGYRVSGSKQIIVSVASTVSNIGTDIIPINPSRSIFDKFEYADQKTCNIGIGTTSYSASIIDYDSLNSTIKISKNTEVVIPESTAISVNLSELTSQLVDIGIRTESGGNYKTYYIGFTTVVNGSISTDLRLVDPGVLFGEEQKEVVFDSPLGYYNIPLIYSSSSGSSGVGTGAKVKIMVGENGNVIDFNFENNGYAYKKGDILTLPTGGLTGIPTDSSGSFEEFKIFVDSVYYSKFASWSIGDLLVIDNFDNLFDGKRRIFPIKVNNDTISIKAKRGSTLDVQSSLIVLFNDILQVPGEGYTFKGGSIIYFSEAPKYGDRVSIIFYQGNEEVDVLFVNVLETVERGDTLKITSDKKTLNQDKRLVTDIIASDYANTNPYSGRGINGDFNLLRPVILTKQNIDLVIDGENVGKDRIYYEPSIYPATRVIQDIGIASTEIYVESLKTFFDNDAEGMIDEDKFIIKIIDQSPIRPAIATCQVSSAGTIFGISVIDGGYGYKNEPIVSIQNSSISINSEYSLTLTSIVDELGISTTGLSSAILGEELIGVESNSIALLSGISTTDTNISYISLNSSNFVEDEEIRFETSGLSAKILTIGDSNIVNAEAHIVNSSVSQIDIINPGYGYTYGPISELRIISSGSGYPETLNPSNNIFSGARLKSVTGNGINATANITISLNQITQIPGVGDFELVNTGANYSVGDIVKIDTFDNIGIGLTNRNKPLTTPITFEVTSIRSPEIIVSPPIPDVEIIKNVIFSGDFGNVVGIAKTLVGVDNKNALIFDLYIPENSYLRNNLVIGNTVVGSAITISQLKEYDYFVISNSTVAGGVETRRTDDTIIGISTSGDYINNVYQVYSSEIVEKDLTSIELGIVYVNRITALVTNHATITLNPDPNTYNLGCANYSWGKVSGISNRIDPKEFKTYQNTISGIASNPIIQRFKPLRYTDYDNI